MLIWLVDKTADWSYSKVLDWLNSAPAAQATKTLSKAEVESLAEHIVAGLKTHNAEKDKRQIYRELERDPAIRGVGASLERGARPEVVVPRSEFPERAGEIQRLAEDDRRRTVTSEIDVVLVSPVLKSAERSWRFQHAAYPEFGAKMKDHSFLDALASGDITVPMKPGLRMRIELQSREEMEAETWVVKERVVTRVFTPTASAAPFLPTER